MLFLPVRCLNGHVVAKTDQIKKFTRLQKEGVPLGDVMDMMGLIGKKRECCRVIFMTTVDNKEK
jgi:DNA-directed RNA polymerase subunit N (RpoN/RPB10)